mmetsp:Transcript_6934/g.10125  ORF Transcript_6934/g.10125 Transcript_6934/m.10125 type:complete len:239 (+) Transcript_6934:60-776(+)
MHRSESPRKHQMLLLLVSEMIAQLVYTFRKTKDAIPRILLPILSTSKNQKMLLQRESIMTSNQSCPKFSEKLKKLRKGWLLMRNIVLKTGQCNGQQKLKILIWIKFLLDATKASGKKVFLILTKVIRHRLASRLVVWTRSSPRTRSPTSLKIHTLSYTCVDHETTSLAFSSVSWSSSFRFLYCYCCCLALSLQNLTQRGLSPLEKEALLTFFLQTWTVLLESPNFYPLLFMSFSPMKV